MIEKIKRLFLNTGIFALGNLGSKIINFLLVPLLTANLTTVEYGTMDLCITSVYILVPVVSLCMDEAVFRFSIGKRDKHYKILSCGIKWIGYVGLIPFIIGTILMLKGNRYFIWGLVCYLSILFMYRSVLSIFLKSINKNYFFSIDSVLYSIYILIFVNIFVLYFNMSVFGFLLSYILATMISIIQILFIGKINVFKLFRCSFDISFVKLMLAYSSPIVFNTIAQYMTNFTDRYMIRFMIDASAAGIYAAAAKVPAIIGAFAGIFNQAWLISSIEEFDGGRDERFFSIIFKYLYIFFIVGISLFLPFLSFFMSVYVGKEFAEARLYVPFLFISAEFQYLAAFFGTIYSSAYKSKEVARTTVIAGVINVILNAFLILFFGIMGAVFATLFSHIVFFLIRLVDTRKFFEFPITYKKFVLLNVMVFIQCLLVIFWNEKSVYSLIVTLAIILIINKDLKLMFKHITHLNHK